MRALAFVGFVCVSAACSSRYFADVPAFEEDGGADASTDEQPLPLDDAAVEAGDGSTVKRVFVTSTIYDGNLGGLQGADDKCQKRADAAVLGGTFFAWLGTPSTNPIVRFQRASTYVSLDGRTIAYGWSDLVDGSLAAPVVRTETGTDIATTDRVWTGVGVNGASLGDTCQGWATSASSESGFTGNPNLSGTTWTQDFSDACNASWRLYCFEQ